MKRKETIKKNLREKSLVLSKVVTLTSKLYHEGGLSQTQKNLLQTLIGAGIFYLPGGKDLYSGKISRSAIESLRNDPKGTRLVKEHSLPRKVSGKLLYEVHLEDLLKEEGHLEKLFMETMGKYNYVLKSENDRLRKFQKEENFTNPEETYREAGIELVNLSMDELRIMRKSKEPVFN